MKSFLRSPTHSFFGAALVGLFLLLVGIACTAGGRDPSPSRLPDVIDLEEIHASSASNVWDLIHQVRPNWLRSRGPSSLRDPAPVYPVVYLGDMSYGPLETLRGFSIIGVQEIRFIGATTATTRFGSGHAGGIIQLLVRR